MSKKIQKMTVFFILILLIGIGIKFSSFLTLDSFQAYRSQLTEYSTQNQASSILIFALIYIFVTAASLPGAAVLTLVGGALFGVLFGVLVVSFASTIGATLAFLLSRYLFQDFFNRRFGNFFAKIDQGIKEQGSSYLFSMRLLPLFPFFVVNALMGLTRFSVFKFFIVSQIGMLPGTIVYVWAGSELGQVTTTQGLFGPGLILAFATLALFPYFISWLVRLYKENRLYRHFTKPKRFDYNVIVIGAGAAGLVSTAIARAVKAKVAIIEGHKMGGDCLNFGCVPSKALIHASQSNSKSYDEVRQHISNSIKTIEPHDSAERFRSMGADVFHGQALVKTPWEVQIGEKTLSTRSIIIATGAAPVIPKVPGLELVNSLTSDTIWDLKKLPTNLLIIGAGPIGCELAQAFAKLGAQVSLIERGPHILPNESTEVSSTLIDALKKCGVQVLLNTSLVRFDSIDSCVLADSSGTPLTRNFESVLFAVGRKPRTQGFGLEKLGIELNQNGTIAHNEFMQTKFSNIYVCGDVAGPIQLTHVAGHQAWYASVNSLFSTFKKFKEDLSVIPRCTFTSPEVASVGESEEQLKSKTVKYEVIHFPFDTFDRAVCDQATSGFVRLLIAHGTDRILGATVVAPRAGEMIMEFTLAMRWKLGLKKILSTVHPYPSWSDANKLAALAWQKKHAPQGLLKIVEKYHDWKRS